MAYLFFLPFFIFLGILLNPLQMSELPSVHTSWFWDKKEESGTLKDKRTDVNPFKLVSGYRLGDRVYSLSSRQAVSADKEEITEVPFFGRGFFSYKKVGSEVSFYSMNGELLWQKPYKSYPFSHPAGSLNFMVSGDGNQVLIVDENGNPAGSSQADGNFLSDICFAPDGHTLLVFSGGQNYLLDNSGKIIWKAGEEKDAGYRFYKNGAISEKAERFALHFNEDKNGERKDRVAVYAKTGEPVFELVLDKIYPFKISMAVSDSGQLLINTNDRVLLFDPKGIPVHRTVKSKEEAVYQTAFETNGTFIASFQNMLLFLNRKGEVYFQKNSPEPVRIFKNRDPSVIFLESPSHLESMTFY